MQFKPCRGGSTVPEFYGKPSPYSAGTGFLGTPPDHREVSLYYSVDCRCTFNSILDLL